LKITPPSGASDARVKTYNFIEAVQKLRSDLSEEDMSSIVKQIGGKFPGRVRSLFVILDDDKIKTSASGSGHSGRNKRGAPASSEAPPRSRARDV
jgi:hypothetical protein